MCEFAILLNDIAAHDDGIDIGHIRVEYDSRDRIRYCPHVDVAFAQKNNVGLFPGSK